MENEIILASASPRRRELLAMFDVPFRVIPAAGEEHCEAGLAPGDTVEALARAKAAEVAAAHPDAVVIGSDTVVERDGVLLGKPRDETEAFAMLQSLSGRSHQVWSGVCVMGRGRCLTAHEMTVVHFRPLSDEEIRAYIRSGEPMDKAGAYGCQGRASLFVEKLEGDFFNVMGLPLCRLGLMLKELGVELL
ncbi:MAG: septum formation inhibitor Maf [Oscillospiraceae bacterium]|nr:septum formation inhibitor Maf [Oscillospiraceae bacterium]